MKQIDYKTEFADLYRQDSTVSLVEVPTFEYLMIDGEGDPNTARAYTDAIETLYPLSYAIRSIVKDEQELAFVVMPLEGLWWVPDMTEFSVDAKDEWQWTAMIMQPEVVTESIVDQAREQVRSKKDLPALESVRYESLSEGLAAQVLHVGPYSAEEPTIERLHDFIDSEGHSRRGKHHEIYLNDARRTDPEKLKTIIRQPVAE